MEEMRLKEIWKILHTEYDMLKDAENENVKKLVAEYDSIVRSINSKLPIKS